MSSTDGILLVVNTGKLVIGFNKKVTEFINTRKILEIIRGY